jgi:hypothetical protein
VVDPEINCLLSLRHTAANFLLEEAMFVSSNDLATMIRF